jgi:hypothetical protein
MTNLVSGEIVDDVEITTVRREGLSRYHQPLAQLIVQQKSCFQLSLERSKE